MIARHHFTELNHLALSLEIGGFRSEMLSWGFYRPEWWRNYWHEHSYFEICYVYAGCGTFRLGDNLFNVGQGDIFVAKPGEPHEIIADKDDPMGIYFWSYTLIPHSRALSSAPIDELLHAFTASDRWVNQTPSTEMVLWLLTEEIVERRRGYIDAIRGLVVKLLLDTARAVIELPQTIELLPPLNLNEQLASQIERYLQDNYSHPVQLRDVAAYVHLSERHANRVFQQVKGVSIKEYLIRYRLKIAKQLLLDKHMPVTEVAYRTGYRDPRYFSTMFRQRTGVQPSIYRTEGGTTFH